MDVKTIAEIITSLTIIAGVIIPIVVFLKKLKDGILCLMRNTMLRIYYNHEDAKIIRQYEYENFVRLFKAYSALGGNSFINDIYEKIKTWEIVT